MIYQINNMVLKVTQELLCGEVNDVVVCQDLSAATKIFYVVWVIKDNETSKKILSIYDTFEKEATYICKGTFQEFYLYIYPYEENRSIGDFFMSEVEDIHECENMCTDIVVKCISCNIPYPIMYLQLEQKQLNRSKAGEIYFTYAIDLKDISEEIEEKECVTKCSRILFNMVTTISDENTVTYTLLEKKTSRGGYYRFIDLYKDFKAVTTTFEKRSLWTRIKDFFVRNSDRLFRFIIFISIVALIIALCMIISNIIFGEFPLFRIFYNTFKEIGTESLIE